MYKGFTTALHSKSGPQVSVLLFNVSFPEGRRTLEMWASPQPYLPSSRSCVKGSLFSSGLSGAWVFLGISNTQPQNNQEEAFISISCHFAATKVIHYISIASLLHYAILLGDLPCGGIHGLGNDHCTLAFMAWWKQKLKLQSLQLQTFRQSNLRQTCQPCSR